MLKHFSDALSAILIVCALLLFAQPDSQVRTLWRKFRQERATEHAITRSWGVLSAVAVPLWADGGTPQLIEVSDYECPFCRRVNGIVDSAVALGVRVAYLHYPVPSHPQAKIAALAAICANQVGQFRPLHRYFMRDSSWRTGTAWEEHATRAGIREPDRLVGCMDSPHALRELQRHMALADTVAITGTPTFLGRNGVHRGVATLDELRRLARADR